MHGQTLLYVSFGIAILLVIISLTLWTMGKRKKGEL